MKKIQEEMIARFRERFVLDPAKVFFGDLEELKIQGWEVGKSQLIIKQDVKPKELEAFILEWSEKLLQEPREEFTKEEYMLFEHMKRTWLKQTNSETHKDWFRLYESLGKKVRRLLKIWKRKQKLEKYLSHSWQTSYGVRGLTI